MDKQFSHRLETLTEQLAAIFVLEEGQTLGFTYWVDGGDETFLVLFERRRGTTYYMNNEYAGYTPKMAAQKYAARCAKGLSAVGCAP